MTNLKIQKVLRTGVREHHAPRVGPPGLRGWLLKASFSILKELGRFGNILEAAGTVSLANPLFFLISLIFHEIFMPGEKSRIFDEKMI